MHISALKLKKFRNLDLETDLSPVCNIIVGRNGAGKSNFLDAIHYLAYGKSFKNYTEGTNIEWESKIRFSSIIIELVKDEGEDTKEKQKLKVIFSESGDRLHKKYEINGVSKRRSSFIQQVHAVLFTPQSLEMLSGTPGDRRQEIDDFISTINEEYAESLSEYRRVVRNRNKVLQRLQEGLAEQSELFFWTEKLVELAVAILKQRKQTLEEFLPVLEATAKEIYEIEANDFKLAYLSKFFELGADVDVEEQFKQKIKEGINKEIRVGRTLYGPHRDDFELFLRGRSLKVYGSRGQQRLGTLILKVAMWDYISKKTDSPALFLLDDIQSELDASNRKKLEDIVNKLDTQVFVTSTDKDFFTKEFLEKAKVIELSAS